MEEDVNASITSTTSSIPYMPSPGGMISPGSTSRSDHCYLRHQHSPQSCTGGSSWVSDGSRPAPLGSNQARSIPYPSPGNAPLQQAWIARFTQSLRMLLLEIEDNVVHIVSWI